MRAHRSAASSLTVSISFLLSYTIVLSLCAPFIRRVEAAPVAAKNGPAPAGAQAAPGRGGHREGELIVRFREGVAEPDKTALAAARGARRARPLRGESRLEKLELQAGQDPAAVAAELRLNPAIELAEPNFLIHRDEVVPDDPRFPEQWALRNTGATGGLVGSDIGAAMAWETTTGAVSTVIAIVDSGVDFTHPDLRGNQWTNEAESANHRDDDRNGLADDLHGWDWVSDSGVIKDEQGHGTMVAGIIAAQGNNSLGTSGVMWRASLMSLRVLDSTGTGDIAHAVEAIDYAVAHGAQVINCSWGTDEASAILRDAIQRAGRRGVVVVCSAGNEGRDLQVTPYYPASFGLPNLVSVAATDGFDQLTAWSNRGTTHVTVAAPGTDMLTTQMGGGYRTATGTSVSAPLVSGIAGLIKTVRPWLSANGTAAAIKDGVRRVAELTNAVSMGGVASASGALGALRGPNNPTPTASPGGNNGGNNGNGPGGQTPPFRAPEPATGGTGPGGSFSVTPPAVTKGAPGPNLPNLDHARRSTPSAPKVAAPIRSNLAPICEDCYEPQGSSDPNFSTGRTDPRNETGQPGVDLGSRNFNWSLPLLGLPGRAGLDLNLALYYNSLVWSKQGNSIKFNADRGYPAPGFHLGFPTLQRRYYNSETGTWAYMLVTSSGASVELRQTDVYANTYESTDGSNIQLTQYWKVLAGHTGKGLDVSGGGRDNGSNIHQWDYLGGANQQWQFAPVGGGYYKILARHTNKALDVAGGSVDNGGNVHQWDYLGGLNQQWQVTPVGNGNYKIIARHSGKALDVSGGGTYNGANIHQWDYLDGLNQQWQLWPAGGSDTVVRMPDGTQYTFAPFANGEQRCTEVKDRNGNYISITYTAAGRISTITDTLARVVTFNYDYDGNLASITQTWNGATHTWASFGYNAIYVSTNFPGLYYYGPNNAYISALMQVSLADGSRYNFSYNSWGQVYRITRYAPDGRQLAYTSYNLPLDNSQPQSECPRFTERRDWAQDWNNNAEAVTRYSVDPNGAWSKMTLPDSTVHKELFATGGWQKGLTTGTEQWTQDESLGGEKKKWTTTEWTQDDTTLSYPKNPRPVETNIHDSDGKRRRTRIEYTSYSLPSAVYEYAADAATVLRRTHTDYNLAPAYVERRVIGLVGLRLVYDGAGRLLAKTFNKYDWDVHLDELPQPATQHDAAGYSKASLIAGRGNLSAIERYDASDPDNVNKRIEFKWSHNTTGAVTLERDAEWHQTFYYYEDSFSDGNNSRNTFAYPTRVRDADGADTSTQYHYDLGAVTRRQGPPPAGQSQGMIETLSYDSAGRLERITNGVNGAFKRWVYPDDGLRVFTYAAVNSVADEAHTHTAWDGAGRVRGIAQNHPGSTGQYSAQMTEYDVMGRAVKQSNPVEINSSWVPTGDDTVWTWTLQAYDWKGRPTLTTNPDGSTRENVYDGCGCAGGEQVTLRDERGRRRKLSQDVLGRLQKVEELNYSGSVYATTTYSYNGRDQLELIDQQGRQRSFEYDGHGRLAARVTPEQGRTEYRYYADDTLRQSKDARQITSTWQYNGRHLPTSISYSDGTTPGVGYAYDAAGNRTSMTDGLGSVSYQYNQLSQLQAETRSFTNVGAFTLSYQYNLAGQLTQMTNPWGVQVGYHYDTAGRVTSISGANYAGLSSYVNSVQYRASGAPKQVSYGNSRVLNLQYDSRLRLTRWDVAGVFGYDYTYHYYGENGHRATYAYHRSDTTLDRAYGYDQVGRLTEAYTGSEARATIGLDTWGHPDGPYAQRYEYDPWGNLTRRYGWGGEHTDYAPSYDVNNRRVGSSYDAAGNITNDGGQNFTYDATGQQVSASFNGLAMSYDGERLRVKKTENGVTTYYLRSSVLGGQVLAEISPTGNWNRGYVYFGSQLLALQDNGVYFVHQDPVTKGQRVTTSTGSVDSTIEVDPWGGETWRSVNSSRQPHKYTSYERDGTQADEAMHRRYNRWWSRFDQPDPSDGSYDLTDPQSFNRYAYVQNDPINFVDPTGLNLQAPGGGQCTEFDNYGACIVRNNDPFTLTGGAAILALWNPIGNIGGGGSRGGEIGGGGGGGGGTRTGAPPQPPAPNQSSSIDVKLLTACLGDVAINFTAKSTPILGGLYGIATDYFGTELHPLQWLTGTDKDLYASGPLDYASATGNIARDLSRLEYGGRGGDNRNGDVSRARAQDIVGRGGKTSPRLRAKELRNLKYLNMVRPFAKAIPVLSQLLNIADAASDIADCVQRSMKR